MTSLIFIIHFMVLPAWVLSQHLTFILINSQLCSRYGTQIVAFRIQFTSLEYTKFLFTKIINIPFFSILITRILRVEQIEHSLAGIIFEDISG